MLGLFFRRINGCGNRKTRKVVSTSERFFESLRSTIFALSTNVKNAGSAIAVIRVAGPATISVVDQLTGGKFAHFRANPRRARLQNFYDTTNGDLIDKGMLLWFPKPKSYTGEDMCEFHIHGSQAVIAKMLAVLARLEGCRPAVQGEFTKRALVNGKLQLIEAEGIRDLINAKTDAQRKRALSAWSNSLEGKFNEWRQCIIKQMAHLEAYIDFSEDELIESKVIDNLKNDIRLLNAQIQDHVAKTKQKSDLIKDGLRIAIIGEANVGKSSLINKLCEKDLSIISPISGTTRDVVETWIDFAGYSVCIADTAGIKDLACNQIDTIEREGIRRAIQRTTECDIIILVLDSSRYQTKTLDFTLPQHILQILQIRSAKDLLLVLNKVDLIDDEKKRQLLERSITFFEGTLPPPVIPLSCHSNEGFEEFCHKLKLHIESCCGDPNSEILFSNERHIAHLEESCHQLERTLRSMDLDLAIAASHLQRASYELGSLTGNITTDDVLNVIFKDFCIGK